MGPGRDRWLVVGACALVLVCVAAVVIVLASTGNGTATPDSPVGFLDGGVRPYRVPSGSMEPTLPIGTSVIVEEGDRRLHVGEIVVFHPPAGASRGICGPKPHAVGYGRAACVEPVDHPSDETFVKRIVAGPDDWLYIKEGHVYRSSKGRDGPYLREPDAYIRPCGKAPECDFPTPIEVPANAWYLLGDNRGDSEDSRFWGAVPTEWVTGKVAGYSSVHYGH